MPWVHANLRGQKVFARADASGALEVSNGRVEVRYKPNDGRRYDARADNVAVTDAKPLPDDTCGPAEVVAKPDPATKPAGRGATNRATAAPTAAPTEGTVIAYADGACSGNPGPAGLGVVVLDGKERTEISEYLGVGTNNIGELTAVLRALEAVDPSRPMMIYTDSQYTIGVLQKGWKAKANVALIAELRTTLAKHKTTRLAYVPGHAGVVLNERADALAREAVSSRKTRREVFLPKALPADTKPEAEGDRSRVTAVAAGAAGVTAALRADVPSPRGRSL